MLVGGHRTCCNPKNGGDRLDHLELGDPAHGPHHLHPPVVLSGGDAVDLVERVVAVLLVPQNAGARVDGQSEAVADAVGEDLLDVRADLATDAAAKWKNGLSRGVVPSSLRRRTTPVRWALSGSGPPNWSSGIPGPNGPSSRFCVCPRRPLSPMMMNSLALSRLSSRTIAVVVVTSAASSLSSPRSSSAIAAIAVVAHLEPDDAAVVVAARAAGRRRPETRAVESGSARTCSARPFQMKLSTRLPSSGVRANIRRVDRSAGGIHRRALRPEQIDTGIAREARVKRNPEQAAFGRGVDGEIQGRRASAPCR